MAEQTPTAQQNSATNPSTTIAANAEAAKAAADLARQAPNKQDATGEPLPQTDNDPMRELLEYVDRARALIANADPNLAERIQILTRQGADPRQRAQRGFRHQVAYAVQDLEKSLWPLPMAAELRSEMTRLAATAPGLENGRMHTLMDATASLEDRRLI